MAISVVRDEQLSVLLFLHQRWRYGLEINLILMMPCCGANFYSGFTQGCLRESINRRGEESGFVL